MHQMSPGVERAIRGARDWADRLGSPTVHLAHLTMALIDVEEGRPAVLLERIGLSPAVVSEQLQSLHSPPASEMDRLFFAARDWSLTHRHDPEFLTDAFLLVVLRADPAFEQASRSIGLDVRRLEAELTGESQPELMPEPDGAAAEFAITPAADDIGAARILDANLNRAREAARVIEEHCRFVLNDRFLCSELKEMRHTLATAAERIAPRLLLASRDTIHDVGTSVSAGGEYARNSTAHVAAVNLKRLQESLRSLEEYGKIADPALGREFEALRYRAYTLERAIVSGGWAREKLAGAKLYVLLTGANCPAALDWTIERAAAGGTDIVQLREKALAGRELLEQARHVRRWTRKAGVLFIVNDHPEIARLADADGVHLGQDDLTVTDARRIVGHESLIGVSTHSIEQLRRAILDGADYIGVGPVFPSPTKSFDRLAGLEYVRAAAAETSLPAFCLGGITPANVNRVLEAGGSRIAVSSAVGAAADPAEAARFLRDVLERSQQPEKQGG